MYGNKRKAGFTLIEVVVTMVIIGILTIIAVPHYAGYVRKARVTEGIAILGQIYRGQQAYWDLHAGVYATTYTALDIEPPSGKFFNGSDAIVSVCDASNYVEITNTAAISGSVAGAVLLRCSLEDGSIQVSYDTGGTYDAW